MYIERERIERERGRLYIYNIVQPTFFTEVCVTIESERMIIAFRGTDNLESSVSNAEKT